MKLNFKQRLAGLLVILAVIGPGIITSNVDNDAGGIATYSLAGAQFGYTLLWISIPVLILLVIVQEMCSRLGVVTGKGLADLIRENFSLRMTFIIMSALVIVNITNTISEFAGIAAASEIFGISRYFAVPLSGLFVWWIILKSNYKSVEKVFLAACVFYIAYLISGFMVKPDWAIVAKASIIPTFHFSKVYIMAIVGIIGTTIAPWMQFYMQSSIVEKGIKKEELKYSRIDVIVGSFLAVIVAFFIVLTTAATIFKSGVNIETASDAALALGPLAGKYAEYLFAFGLLNASLFAASILPLSTAYSVSEAFGWELGVNRKFSEARRFYGLYGLMIILGMVFVLIPGFNLITLMYFSQVLNGILLPFVIILMLILINKNDLMGEYKNGKIYNIIIWLSSIIIILLSVAMVYLMIF
ncbi:Divalent metal cation transporter MntH [uncultured archaeon]|nr:Divalent metal cation transporter MntH [uncultured archaeon]